VKKKTIKLRTLRAEMRKLLREWACRQVREDIVQSGEIAMAKTAKRQAARDKVKAKTKAKAVEMITARKSSRKKKKGR
jgi:hypothetical protein